MTDDDAEITHPHLPSRTGNHDNERLFTCDSGISCIMICSRAFRQRIVPFAVMSCEIWVFLTSGLNGGSSMLASSRLKLMFLKIGCCLTSMAPRPWQPSLSFGSLARSWNAAEEEIKKKICMLASRTRADHSFAWYVSYKIKKRTFWTPSSLCAFFTAVRFVLTCFHCNIKSCTFMETTMAWKDRELELKAQVWKHKP